MRPPRKPGPKSQIRSNSMLKTAGEQSKHPVADLGETDTSGSDVGGLATDDRGFRSPTADTDGTDYGLEFTATGSRYLPNSLKECRPGSNNSDLKKASENSICRKRLATVAKQNYSTVQAEVTVEKSLEGLEKELEGAQNVPADPSGPTVTLPSKTKQQKRKAQRNLIFLKSYKKLAERVDFMIARGSFSRVVREIMLSMDTDVKSITATAFEALQVATEAYVEGRLEDANLLALHAKRVTLMANDMELINFLRTNHR